MNKWKLNRLKRIQHLTIFWYHKMQLLMNLFQLILEKNERQKHTKRQRANILKKLKLMKLEHKLIQINEGQFMRLQMELISKSLNFP